MREKYVLTIDQSTSSTKAILFDKQGQLVKRSSLPHKQYYPKPGWVEHDPEEIYKNTLAVIRQVLSEAMVDQSQIIALSITNQRETVLVWDKNTGKPVYNAIVWQCQRAEDICSLISKQGYSEKIRKKTGLILSPYFSAAKVRWIMENIEGKKEKAYNKQLLFGTIDTWLLWKLTGAQAHITDYSNASRTQLFNINTLQWDWELLDIFDIPISMMPEIQYSDEIFGFTNADGIFSREIPVTGIMGDSHAALFGQNCFEKGMAKATYGTGSSVMMNIGERPVLDNRGLVTSIAWGLGGKVQYVLEGNINCTGDTINWLKDNLGMLESAEMSEEFALQIDDNEGVYLVPAFTGLSAPYWNSDARAIITGMSRGTGKAHIIRAAIESIAYQIKDIVDLMVGNTKIEVKELRVDGGPTRNNFLMQFQSDMLDVPVARTFIEEISALGSAYAAGLAVGLWNDLHEIGKLRISDRVFESSMPLETRERNYLGWKRAVSQTLLKS